MNILDTNSFSNFAGFEIKTSPLLTKEVEVPVKKQWWDRVIEWNPCNVDFIKPDFTYHQEAAHEIVVMGNTIFCHPDTLHLINKAAKDASNRRYQSVYPY